MQHTLDARGLSCPQPVLLAIQAMRSAESEDLKILVDNEASQENVARAAVSQGWSVQVQAVANGEYTLTCKKS
ncbi:MAG: preprotein translocase subunit TatB [Desulfovibrionales bacterium]|nr:preprotein translocase subunit TatB [Desulfovibrionales bacterium]